jgi:hypothetical protein
MTLPRNNQIQQEIIAKLKASTTVTAEVTAEEIREDQWQGTDFSYPNIRVKMISNKPDASSNCFTAAVTLSIQVFSEDASSYEADDIAGIINDVLHDHPFSSSGLKISLRTTNLVPAIRSDVRTWRSEVLMAGIVSG